MSLELDAERQEDEQCPEQEEYPGLVILPILPGVRGSACRTPA